MIANHGMPLAARHSTPRSARAWVSRWLAACRGFLVGTLVMLLAAGGASDGRAQAPRALEHQVKAAFLYKFLSYVQFPARPQATPDAPLTIGVIGADALADELAQLAADRRVNGLPVIVRKLRAGDSVSGLHILFIGRAANGSAASTIATARAEGILTVTESEDAFARGSVINFVVVDDKVRFDIALQPAEQANLKISSRLLAIARKLE